MPKVKAELEQMGVVRHVREPTDWYSGIVVVPKGGGRVRICVDLTRLNKNMRRVHDFLPAVKQALAQLPEARVFQKSMPIPGFGRFH